MSQCIIEGCVKTARKNRRLGLCSMHEWRLYKYGDAKYTKWPRHGDFGTPEHKTWLSMIARCHNPNTPAYQKYGAKGVSVCDRWRYSYVNFIQDMGRRPTDKHSIDRIDNSIGYEPGNCHWATRHQQIANRKRKHSHAGVFFTNQTKRWEAQLKIDGKFVLRKKFQTEREAIKARQEAEKQWLGAIL